MPAYGYIRTSRDLEPGHPGSDPEVQRRQLADAGVEPGRIYADVAVSGATPGSSRGQWHLLDHLLAQGDVLVVAAVDRLGRRYIETMWAIYDLQRRGAGSAPWPTTRVSGLGSWTPTPTRRRPSWATSWPAWRPTWPARSARASVDAPGRGCTPPEGRARSWAGRGVSPRSSSPPSARTWRTRCPWPPWPGSTGCPGPRSAERSTVPTRLGRIYPPPTSRRWQTVTRAS